MPLTEKGKRVRAELRRSYGKEKGDRVFYAMENSGKIKGVAKKGTSRRR